MKVLIIGSGGREHALAWKCAQSPRVAEVLVAPGNAGTATEPRVRNVAVPAEDDRRADRPRAARARRPDDRRPRGPLVMGVVDAFEAAACAASARASAAAQLEGSKAFTKEFLRRHGIPTAATPLSRARTSTRNGYRASARRSSSRPAGSRPARA
jgi:phosphoribosylamine---glycine ligase